MISEVTYQTRHLILDAPSTPNTITIKAYLEAYGFGRSFIRYFSDETGDIILCQKDNKTYIHVENDRHIDEVSDFLKTTATTVYTESKIPQLEQWLFEQGNEYTLDNPQKLPLCDITSEIGAAHAILADVFPDDVGFTAYPSWYTDLSQRVRHEVSKVYTIGGKCTATVFANDRGVVLISQLATKSDWRNQGLATALLAHIVHEQDANCLMLYSANSSSDRYYEKNGFTKTGEWYGYARK